MSVLIVAYDLHGQPGKNRDLLKYLNRYDCTRLTESTYAIDTTKNTATVLQELRSFLEMEDACYVINLRKPYCEHGPGDASDWLNQRLSW